ncbi:phage tail tape measure protein [Microbacterium sp. UFMG61]|uniref:phage tail tape measure protein n=1 Tax=Microbacterium sp. UFMG61 TaxID=2745935 RepID=UPI001890B2F3|nr:phage tail tape measure protein [Microbacterium sp. UFMG61]
MAERVVKVRLSAVVEDYKKGMREAAEATRTVGTQAEKLAQVRQSMQLLGTTGVAMGAALAAGVGVAIAKFAEFDQAMSYVAATGDDARQNMDALRQAALDAGAATVLSATESANAIEEMAKAGLSAKEILSGGLAGALDLAAAGGLDVADAAGIAATALKTFNLEGSDMSHVADLLAAGAGKAMGDVTDLSAALNQTALVANSTGLSIEETTAGLAAFASQGLLGSDAGTSFKTMLGALTPNSAKAADEMKRLGISAYDASGNFVGLEAFAGQLKTQMSGLTDEQRNASLEIMFGSDAVRAATVLYSEGESGIRDWIAAVDDQGYAAETAATRLDNLIGDWEALTGALDSAFISMGEGADGPLRYLVQQLTVLVDSFNTLPDWAKQLGVGLGAVAAGAGLVGGGILLAIPKIAEFRDGLITLGISAARTDRIMGGLQRAVGAAGVLGAFALATAAVDAMAEKISESFSPSAEELTNKFRTATDAAQQLQVGMASVGGDRWDNIEQGQEALSRLSMVLDDAKKAQDDFWYRGRADLDPYVSAVRNLGDEYAELAKTDLPQAQANFRELADAAGLTDEQMGTLLDEMEPFKKALTEQATAAGQTADEQTLLNLAMGEAESPAQTATEAYMDEADAVANLHSQFMDLIDAIDQANGMNRDAVSSNIEYQDTLRDVEEQIRNISDGVEGFGRGLDITTQAGADNKAMLVALSEDAWDAAAAQLALDGDTANFTATLEAQRQKLYEAAIQMGASEEEAAILRDTLLAMPPERTIQVIAETSTAQSKVSALWGSLNDLVGRTWNIPVATSTVGVGTVLKPDGYATGGRVTGPGTTTSDSIPAYLSKGEYVLTAQDVSRAGGHDALDAWRSGDQAAWVPTSPYLAQAAGGTTQPSAPQDVNVLLSLKGSLEQMIDARIEQKDDELGSGLRGW